MIDVDAQAIWCGRHRAAVALDPKRVFALASVRVFDFAVRDPRIQIACGYDPSTGTPADRDKLTEVIRAHSPLCCFLPGEMLNKALREAYPGVFEHAQATMIKAERIAEGYRPA